MSRFIKCDRCQATQDQFFAMQDHWRKLVIGPLLDGYSMGPAQVSYEMCPICAREVADIITKTVLEAAGLATPL